MWSGWRWPQRCRALFASVISISGRIRGDAGKTGGRPKCMSGRQLARTGPASAPATPPGICSKPKSPSRAERRRCPASVAGCLHRQPGRALFERTAALCLEALKGAGRHGCRPRFDSHGAAGAVKRPVFRAPPWGKRTKDDRRPARPGAGQSNGAMTCVLTSNPHPEEARSAVSKGEARKFAASHRPSSFETRFL